MLTGKVKAALRGHSACVRDVSWHPYRTEIISSGATTARQQLLTDYHSVELAGNHRQLHLLRKIRTNPIRIHEQISHL
ncbi:unnamed protein product [Timema podura]|uniref:Uncharacterized protein n=1 Tax=Timema podura TaxID=61482 RepID=A0ABN7PC33_TIMPD|nr:unnamed protein product [Timema podura]